MIAAAVSPAPASSADQAERRFVLKGTLELMRPSALHEESKKIIARLVEVWAEEKNVDLRGFGSTTFVHSPLVDKLAVYAGLRVLEVWVWDDAKRSMAIHGLTGSVYKVRPRSEIVPELDLVLLARFVKPGESHTALAKAYRAALATA